MHICSWGRPFDLIVVDEAGQYSLSNSIAASLYAKQGIFLGDQNQLPPIQQVEPPENLKHLVGSAFSYYLDTHKIDLISKMGASSEILF